MKLSNVHLVLIIIGILMLVNLGFTVKEGLQNKNNSDNDNDDSDKYILKSQIVPPVCPKCPDVTVCPDKEKSQQCTPCPPCGRCPSQPFVNKSWDRPMTLTDYLPRPMLTDFSQF
jgi:hypothetical protein